MNVVAEVVVFGAGGYSGQELLRWLSWHPQAQVVLASSDAWEGRRVAELVPAVVNHRLKFTSHVETLAESKSGQFAMLAVPAKTAAELTPTLLDRGLRVVDLSGGHRLRAEQYPDWYGFEHPFPERLSSAVYGLPELVGREVISKASLVANPGCYATAATLAAGPLVQKDLCAEKSVLVVDGKSGATGAGRSLKTPMLFSELADDVRPYRVGTHQHTPEIERTLSSWSSDPVRVAFAAHLVPMRRGLLCSVYVPARAGVSAADISSAFEVIYGSSDFVNVRSNEPPETKRTVNLPIAEVWAHIDERTQIISAFGAIDNLLKGAAGQAIQNLNLMLGLDIRTGLMPSIDNNV